MSEEKLSQQLRSKLEGISSLYNRLLLLVGTTGSGKTNILRRFAELESCPMVNVGMKLSPLLLGLTERQRILEVPKLLHEIVSDSGQQLVTLDNTEVLFAVALQQDPLRLLQGLARNRTIVASWFGTIDGQDLTHAAPNHPEFRSYSIQDLLIVEAGVKGAESNCSDSDT